MSDEASKTEGSGDAPEVAVKQGAEQVDPDTTQATSQNDDSPNEAFNMETRRRLKNEAHTSSGIGKAKEKDRILDIFWNHIWPKLEELGWTKHDGTGANVGAITFVPSGTTTKTEDKDRPSERYDRIRDVLDRLLERRSDAEGRVATLYNNLEKDVNGGKTSTSKKATPEKSEKASSPARPSVAFRSPKIDLSWKDGGRGFPRKSSRIGEDYQVVSIPKAGTMDEENPGAAECTRLWDPKAASSLFDKEGNLPILDKVSPNKREIALELLAQRSYALEESVFVAAVKSYPARNGSDWPPAKRARFSDCVFALRKDLRAVCKAMAEDDAEGLMDMGMCLAHYYGIFKHSNDYRLVKTVLHDEKLDARTAAAAEGSIAPSAVGEPDACLICDDGGELLICDGCEGEYHMECMDPPLKSVPEGHWECDECVNQKLLRLRDALVRESGLFEAASKKEDGDEDQGPVIFKPTTTAHASIRKMALGISKLLEPVAGADEDEEEEEEEEEEQAEKVKVKQEAAEDDDDEDQDDDDDDDDEEEASSSSSSEDEPIVKKKQPARSRRPTRTPPKKVTVKKENVESSRARRFRKRQAGS